MHYLSLCAILINNLTIFYVDILAIVLVCLLLGGNYNWTQLIILSLLADLFGHWYLGSHLLWQLQFLAFSVLNLLAFTELVTGCTYDNGKYLLFNIATYYLFD